ncbi:MAG: hypothetical protein RI946_1319 [Pseudomonadota bacterium]|jgi:hypothetical protein
MDLNEQLLAAHDHGDKAALVALYHQAAKDVGDINSACFYATQAYIFALDCNHPDARALHAFLVEHGREE